MATKMSAKLVVQAIDKATGPLRRINAQVNGLAKPAMQVSKSLRGLSRESGITRLGGELGNTGRQMAGLARTTGALARNLGLAGAATGWLFKSQFVDTAAQFEKYRTMLTELQGSALGAQEAMDWVSSTAVNTPFAIDGVMKAFVRMRALGLDPMNGSFQAIADQTAVLGGEQERLEGIVLALGQAWTKQKLQGEEILQLVERGVPVWDLLEKATGENVKTLQDLSTKGKLTRKTISLLIEEMGKANEGAAKNQMKTWNGMVANMGDQWIRFKNLVMDAGVFDYMRDTLGGLLAQVDAMAADGSLAELAKSVSEGILSTFKTLKEFGAGAAAVVGALAAQLTWAAEVLGGWEPIITAFGILVASSLLAPLIAVSGALWGLGAALLATPVGWFIGAVALIAGAAYMVVKHWAPIEEFFVGMWERITAVWDRGVAYLMEKVRSVTSFLPDWVVSKIGLNTPMATPAATAGIGAGAGAGGQVGGSVHIKVDSEGRASVKEIKPVSGTEMDVETGWSLLGVGG